MSRRSERIAGELQAELARLLREDVTDPRVGLVTLTRVDVAPDLSHAIVFWSALDVDDAPGRHEELQEGLDSAASFLRHRAASRLPLRRMPALRFRYDPSLLQGSRTLAVLREVAPSEPETPDAAARDDAPGIESAATAGSGAGEEDDGAEK